VIKASARDIIKGMKEVNQDVLPLFNDAAEQIMEIYGDPKQALCATLAYLSGHYKGILENRSLLTGQEKCITMEIKVK
jgi:hypothetical protein